MFLKVSIKTFIFIIAYYQFTNILAAIREDLLHSSEGAYRRHSYLQEDFVSFLEDDNSNAYKEEPQEDISPPPYPDDLVLSVLKSPLNHSSAYNSVKESECAGCVSNDDFCLQDNERDDDR